MKQILEKYTNQFLIGSYSKIFIFPSIAKPLLLYLTHPTSSVRLISNSERWVFVLMNPQPISHLLACYPQHENVFHKELFVDVRLTSCQVNSPTTDNSHALQPFYNNLRWCRVDAKDQCHHQAHGINHKTTIHVIIAFGRKSVNQNVSFPTHF